MAVDIAIKKRLGDFTLDIKLCSDSARLGILGTSGCGKSMTLKCIAGIERPDSGHIIVNGRTLFDSEKHIDLKPQKRRVGYLFQSYALFSTMTVKKNITAGASGSRREKQKRAAELMESFELTDCRNKLPMQLSGGQQQRTALARLIASEPEIVLLDEAFSALDAHLKERLQYEVLGFLKKYSLPAVIVSHDRDEIYKLTDSAAVIDSGAVCAYADTKTLFENPGVATAARITGCKNISPVKKLGEYELFALDWGLRLRTVQRIDESIRFVGIRAHDIQALKSGTENSIPADIISVLESPFEITYIAITPGGGQIWRKLSRDERIVPHTDGYLYLPPEKLLLLR